MLRQKEPTGAKPRTVVVLDPLDMAAVAALREHFDVRVRIGLSVDELPAALRDAHAVVVRSGVVVDREFFRNAPTVRVVARAGSGTDNIDLAAAKESGATVFTVPGATTAAVAELAIGLIFALQRNIVVADRDIRRGVWRKAELLGTEFGGKILGVVGLGNIGSAIALRGAALGAEIVGSVGCLTPARIQRRRAEGVSLLPVDELLRVADIIVLSAPLTAATHHLIDSARLDFVKPSAVLVNVGRGGLVDEEALYSALQSGALRGAALDVHATEVGASRFARLDNVVLTPHIGAMTEESQARVGRIVVEGLLRAFKGLSVPNTVVGGT